jgi:hypothetical protein
LIERTVALTRTLAGEEATMGTMVRAGPVGGALFWMLACGGASLDENEAGGDGWLDHEDPPLEEPISVASDGACAWTGNPFVSVTVERAYVMLYESAHGDCAELSALDIAEHKTVWGLRPGEAVPERLIDVSGHEDVRLLDTSEGLLLMGEVGGAENLYRIDADDLTLLSERRVEARYWGTRTSASRRWVAVADNADPGRLPIQVIDPATLASTEIDPGGAWAEAMWMAQRESLAAILIEPAGNEARLVLWDFAGVEQLVVMPDPAWNVAVGNVAPVLGAGFTWIGIDPLDRYVVFPIEDLASGVEQLLVMDVRDGTVRATGPARGPVAFTPDGGSIVAWGATTDRQLVIVDPVTFDTELLPLPGDGIPEYFVSHEGNEVLVADVFGLEQLVIVDLETGAQTVLPEALPLVAFSSRQGHDEVWLVDGGLWRVDLADPDAEQIPLGWLPKHVVWMPSSDLLYLDDALAPRMILWDPDTRSTVTDVRLDGQLRAPPRLSLAR